MKRIVCLLFLLFLFIYIGRAQISYSISCQKSNVIVTLTNTSDETIYIKPPYDGSFDASYYEVEVLDKEGKMLKKFSDYLVHRPRVLLSQETKKFTFSLFRFKVSNAYSLKVKIHIEGWKFDSVTKRRITVYEKDEYREFIL